jgi:hypothetical protein
MYNLVSSNNIKAPEQALSETTNDAIMTTTSIVPLFSTGNIRFNIDKDGNNLSVPAENSPEKVAEKKYHNFEDGYDTEEEIGPLWDAVLGEEEVDGDDALLPELTGVVPPLVQPVLLVGQAQAPETINDDN